jgi:hypothetical protein
MPPSRHTSIFAMFESKRDDHELEAWLEAGGHKKSDEPYRPIPDACEYSSEQLCEILASGLPQA